MGDAAVNVKYYGATGDGTTDDTAAIQNAIDAVEALGGGEVYFPPGTYLIAMATSTTGPLVEDLCLRVEASDITLFGDGASSILYVDDWTSLGSGEDRLAYVLVGKTGETITNVHIRDLKLLGTEEAASPVSTPSKFIFLGRNSGPVMGCGVSGVVGVRTGGPVVGLGGDTECLGTFIRNCSFANVAASCIEGGSHNHRGIEIINNQFYPDDGSGSPADPGDGVRQGIYYGAPGMVITGNVFRYVWQSAIGVLGGPDHGDEFSIIANNSFFGCGHQGSVLGGATSGSDGRFPTISFAETGNSKFKVTGNTIRRAFGSGISQESNGTLKEIVISDNVVDEFGWHAKYRGSLDIAGTPSKLTTTWGGYWSEPPGGVTNPGGFIGIAVRGSRVTITNNVVRAVSEDQAGGSPLADRDYSWCQWAVRVYVTTSPAAADCFVDGNIAMGKFDESSAWDIGWSPGTQAPAGSTRLGIGRNNFETGNPATSSPLSWTERRSRFAGLKYIPEFPDGDGAPSVAGCDQWRAEQTGATVITALADGVVGQIVTITFADGNTVIPASATMLLRGAFHSETNAVLVLMYDGTTWIEVSRTTAPALLAFGAGSFSRASAGTYQTGSATVAQATSNVLRYETKGSETALALLEGSRTNELQESDDVADSYWDPGYFLTSRTNDAAASPIGASSAGKLVSNGMATGSDPGNDIQRLVSDGGSSKPCVVSAWYRDTVNTGPHAHTMGIADGGSYFTQENPASTVWQRAQKVATIASSTHYAVYWVNAGGAGGNASSGDDLLLWGMQYEKSARFASSVVVTNGGTGTRAADTLVFNTPAALPAQLLRGRFVFDVYPQFADSDLVSGDVYVAFSVDSSSNAYRFRHDGSAVIFEAYVGGAQKAKSNNLTFSRDQKLTIEVDAVAATVAVFGATTGNGRGSAGTAWAIVPSTGLRVGGSYGGADELFGRLSEPRAL